MSLRIFFFSSRRRHTRYWRDWSSDVCSSDLTHLSNPPQWLRRFFHHSSQVLAALNPGGNYVERVVLSPQEALQLEIGRASCRERVEIAVVSLSFKKKNGGSTTRSRV